MATKYVYVNDTFVESDQASLLITDLSIQRGYGMFDFFKTINGKPIFLQDHLDRFFRSAAQMHLQVSQTREELQTLISELQERNQMPDSGIRMTLTGGYSADGYSLAEKPNLVINQIPLEINKAINRKGMSLVTYDYQRQLPTSKTLDYSMAIWLQPFIRENHADEVLYHNNGLVKEIPRANFFIVTPNQEVWTAKKDVLEGVIRRNILNIKDSGYRICEKDFNVDDLHHASEAFISSTTKHILPVLKINGNPVGSGKVGPVTGKLYDLLLEKVNTQSY